MDHNYFFAHVVSFARYAGLFCMCALLGGAINPPSAAAADEAVSQIGTSVIVVNRVTGRLQQSERQLKQGERVFLKEALEASDKSQAELKLDDNTKLALGPKARLVLDEYVVNKKVSLNLVKGAFRFITGDSGSKAYTIKTPTASMGVRGTVVDIYVCDNGDSLFLLHDGTIDICNRTSPGSLSQNCRPLGNVGQIIQSSQNGRMSRPLKFNSRLCPGVTVQEAFPFVGKPLAVDPVARLSYPQITDQSAKPKAP
jgi:hypothetical protein